MRGELRQARAAELLGIGVRQVKRLVGSYRCEGEASVVSRRRGKPSNNRLDAAKAAATKRRCGRATPISERRWRARSLARSRASRCRERRSARSRSGWGSGGQATARQEDFPGSRTPAALRRAHSDRREPARLVRGPGTALHAHRVHRRRHRAVDASAIRAGGDDQGLSAGAGGARARARPAVGLLFGSARDFPRQRQRGAKRRWLHDCRHASTVEFKSAEMRNYRQCAKHLHASASVGKSYL